MIQPDCPFGYSMEHLKASMTPDGFELLVRWMEYRTMSLCDGKLYDHEKKRYVKSDCYPVGHGPIVNESDMDRFLRMVTV